MAPTPQRRGWLTVLCAGTVGVALVGLALGMGAPATAWTAPAAARPDPALVDAQPAPRYVDIDARTRGPNAHYRSDLRSLVSRTPGLADAVDISEESRRATLARRAARRAYAGAPPTIPHPVDANQVEACYACHGQGREVDGLIAPRISHQRYTNCTQCHAQAGTPGPGPELPVANLFAGDQGPSAGIRAYPGAPPQMPHPTTMREDCTSCHGLLGGKGMRTSHPWRMNCVQCHAQSATLNQTDFGEEPPPPWAGQR